MSKEALLAITQGHPEIWACSIEDFIAKVLPVLNGHKVRNNLSTKTIKTAAQFLRLRFDKGDLTGTIDYEVAHSIEMALVYYVNVLGEEP
jgi:hypothetical protein